MVLGLGGRSFYLGGMDSTLQYYERNADMLKTRYNQADVSLLHQRLLMCFAEGARLLDVGCGSGRDADFLARMGYDVLAVDASEAMLQVAQDTFESLIDRCRCVSIPDGLPQLKGARFDGIYSVAMLMHLSEQDIAKALQRFRALLVSDGLLFFSVCLSRGNKVCNKDDRDRRRYTLKPRRWWLEICQSAGFCVVESDETSDGMNRGTVVWLNVLCKKSAGD